MLKEVTKSAATLEAAKAAAMLELGLTEDDEFHYEVIQMPTKKILGLFGGSPAEVKVSVEVPDEKPKKAEKAEKAEKAAPKKAPKKADKPAQKKKDADKKPAAEKPAKAEKAEKDAEPAKSFSERKAELTPSTGHTETADYIASIVSGLGVEPCTVQAYDGENEVLFDLDCGEDYGIIIGHRGETLDAIQYLARMVENKGRQGYCRVAVNVGDYREKREATLIGLAKKNAARALRTGRSVHLEPMNPYERRIIHTAVQGVEGVVSYSTGVDLDRRVIIAPENAPKRDGKNDFRRNDRRGGRRDYHDRPKREPYVPDIAADREKHTDAQSVSLYGKIEVKKQPEDSAE